MFSDALKNVGQTFAREFKIGLGNREYICAAGCPTVSYRKGTAMQQRYRCPSCGSLLIHMSLKAHPN